MWNERRTIVQALSSQTHNKRVREKAWEHCHQLRSEKWRLPHSSHHLVTRDQHYFNATNIVNVSEWNKNIASALSRGLDQIKSFRVIREFLSRATAGA